MADHAVWRGHLRLALVSCPIALTSARHEAANLHFHFINPETGNRVRTLTVDAETEEKLSRADLSRGYEYEKGHYVVLEDADFERARIENSSVLTVEKFVAADSIDPIYFDATYYVVPDGDAGHDVYAVLRDAIARAGRVALSRVVIARRERAVALMPLGRGLVLHTLFEARDLYSPTDAFSAVPNDTPDPAMIDLAIQLIDRQTTRFDPADMVDRYEKRLRTIIDSKIDGHHPMPKQTDDNTADNVVDLMAALKQSLARSAKAGSGKEAKPPISRPPESRSRGSAKRKAG